MGTQRYVGLFYEENCGICNGQGHLFIRLPDDLQTPFKISCDQCNKTGKLWNRMHYTHAQTHKQALDKLLPRLSQWGSLRTDVKWILVWKDRKGKVTNVTNVTKAVEHRWQEIAKKRFPTKCDWCYQMRKGCRIVQVIKWKNETSRGFRNMCPRCRKDTKGEIIMTQLVERPKRNVQ